MVTRLSLVRAFRLVHHFAWYIRCIELRANLLYFLQEGRNYTEKPTPSLVSAPTRLPMVSEANQQTKLIWPEILNLSICWFGFDLENS